jgi:hypothetical protein
MSGTPPNGPGQSDAEKRKAESDARKAEAEAKKAERENEEAESPAANAEKEAQHRKAEAEANVAAAKARRDEVATLIPDFSAIKDSTLDVKGDQPLFGVTMSQRALADVAAVVAKDVKAKLQGQGDVRLLVTADEHLATSDAAYVDVTTGLDQLTEAARKLLEALAAGEGERVAPIAAIGAIASAIPGLVSLFAAKRTVTSSQVTVSDLSAAAAAIGALRVQDDLRIVHDDIRLAADQGKVQTSLSAFRDKRDELTAKKLELEAQKAAAPTARPEDKQRVAELQMRLGLVDSIAAAMDAFLASLAAIPQGATRSRLTDAILRQQLHVGAADRFTHVLLVKSQGGALHEAVDNRPLWFNDRFTILAAVSLTYLLIATDDSHALASGTVAGTATGHGTIGKSLSITNDVPGSQGANR